ncbi:MAG TPA: hypothetical protein VGH20_09645 [Myxococcales bacterium]|jgi:hypothetical protein
MRQALRSGLVLAVVIAAYACSGSFTSGANGPFDPGTGPGGTANGTDGGGADAGDGGDGGTFTTGDAGNGTCNGLPSGMSIVDFCSGSAVATALNVTQNGCSATFTFAGTSTPCTGQLIGANDGFDGGCAGLPLTNCTSLTVPGTITCNTGGTPATCQLKVCGADAGTCP